MSMIGRRKTVFFEMLDLLRVIEQDNENLKAVESLNLLILREIIRSEKKIDEHRKIQKELNRILKTGRLSKENALIQRKKLKRRATYIDAYVRQIYIWKSFGDALAFIYLDKFSIKHAYYETDKFGIKTDAGKITGKSGLVNEVILLLEAIKHKVPAVLCDITNILRYGDVCLLGGSDPHLMEVKSRTTLNQRGKRQFAKLEKLHGFLENDRAMNFRGAPGETKRETISLPQKTYIKELNQCIHEAVQHGTATVEPEAGLHYSVIAHSNPDFEKLMPNGHQRPVVFMWNSDKNNLSWAPYEPFLLTIRDPKHLYDFIEGRIFIIIMVDVEVLIVAMERDGWEVSFRETAEYSLQCRHMGSGGIMGISNQFFARIGYECASPRWVVECHAPNITKLLEQAQAMDHSKLVEFDEAKWRRMMFDG